MDRKLPSGVTTIGLGKNLGGRPVLDAVDLDVPPDPSTRC